jgi:signal transduction histidine kinase
MARCTVTTRLLVLLVLLTALPAMGVLWLMNRAAAVETVAGQQQILEAYRGQLRLVRSRLDPVWRAHAARLDEGDAAPRQRFTSLVTEGIVEGMLVLDGNGVVSYPDRDARRALRAMERQRARDPNVWLPTQAALQLSIELADAEHTTPLPDVVRETSLPGVWALSSPSGRVVALYRTGRLEAMMHDFLHQVETDGIRFIAFPPDEPADAEAIAAGSWLPGWQLSFVAMDADVRNAALARRRALVTGAGLAGLVVLAFVGIAAGQSIRRHLRLASLKTDLVAAASHELRNPLAAMRVLVDGLLADRQIDPVKMREYLVLVARENARLSRVIDNFLTFARLERGRPELTFTPVSPATLVETAIDAVRERLPANCRLDVDVVASLPLVLADADGLGAALVNLLENALKYTADEKRISVRASSDGGSFVRFDVTDNGIGIPAREQRRIFRRFYRVDQRLSRETAGVGLGLSIVELIVRAHGGSVSVHSEPGAGSTFSLHVPCAPREQAA